MQCLKQQIDRYAYADEPDHNTALLKLIHYIVPNGFEHFFGFCADGRCLSFAVLEQKVFVSVPDLDDDKADQCSANMREVCYVIIGIVGHSGKEFICH